MGIFLVGEAKDADQGVRLARKHLVVQHPGCPISAMAAVGKEGADDARLTAGRLREPSDGGKVALKIAAGNAEAGSEIRPLSNAGAELERRYDLVPVGAHALGKFRQRVGSADRGN